MRGQNVILKYFAATAVLAFSLFGCGKANEKAPALDANGKHPANWVVDHRASFRFLSGQCKECHGVALDGGIAKVSCTSTSFDGLTCHANGHPPRLLGHVFPFKDPTLHGPAAVADLFSCAACHARMLRNPRFPAFSIYSTVPRYDLSIGSLANGCEDCHQALTAHPPVDPARLPGFSSGWLGHRNAKNLTACTRCHGDLFEGSIGIACNSCHVHFETANPPSKITCASCHGNPPNGTSFPNRAGRHDAHIAALTESSITGNDACMVCHNGGQSGTLKHYSSARRIDLKLPAVMGFLAAYNAKSGTANINQDKTCGNVSCHGGITTPPWSTGSININTDCQTCHAQIHGSNDPAGVRFMR